MNSETGVLVAVPVSIFSAIDISQSKAIVLSTVIGAILYFLKGKIPDEA